MDAAVVDGVDVAVGLLLGARVVVGVAAALPAALVAAVLQHPAQTPTPPAEHLNIQDGEIHFDRSMILQDKDNNPVSIRVSWLNLLPESICNCVQGPAKEWSLGCVKRAPRPGEARTRESRNLGTVLWPISRFADCRNNLKTQQKSQ